MNFKCVIFDMDGTLLDTLEDLGDAMNQVLQNKGFPIHEIEKFKYFLGNGMYVMVEKALPEEQRNTEMIQECVKLMKEEYKKCWMKNTKPYEGIIELLTALQQNKIKIAILSNKPNSAANILAKEIFTAYVFDKVYGASEQYKRKPHPGQALRISKELGVLPEECIFLGDSNVDMQTGTAARMYPVGVLWGFRDREELESSGAKMTIAHPIELLKIFERV